MRPASLLRLGLPRSIRNMSAESAPIAATAGAERITWKRADGSEVPGYAFGSGPAVIAIQEWWGIDDSILHNAKKIAAAGFRTLVPDLYRGKLGVEAEEAHHLMSNLDWKGAVEDIRGAARYLREVEGARKVGVTGFCMGGALTLAAGVLVEEVDAVASFYGVPGAGLADCAKMRVPVQAHFGQTDNMAGFSDPAAADALEAALKAAGVEHTIIRHPGVGHAFMNDLPAAIERKRKLGQGEHVQAEVDRAMAQMTEFFKAKLA